MHSHLWSWFDCKWPDCKWLDYKWLIVAAPLAMSGCGDKGAEQARELRTHLDEAQVQIEAQAAHLARLERSLAAAGQAKRHTGQRLQSVANALADRTRQLKVLQQQHQILLRDQQHLRQALAQSHATVRLYSQQLQLSGQQNSFLRARVTTLDAWIRQQSATAHTQARELARLRDTLDKNTAGN